MRQFERRESDPARWERRNRKIARLAKSGKTMEKIGDAVGVSRERVRQLLLEMGITIPYKSQAARRHRKLSQYEVDRIEKLYQKRIPVPDIAKEMELDRDYLYHVIAEHHFVRKYQCAICGKEIVRKRTLVRQKYCDDCSADQYRSVAAKYQIMRYRTDPEFKRKKLAVNHAWKKSPAGKKWFAEYRKRLGGKGRK